MKNLALSMAIALMLSGCATQTFQINPSSSASTPTKEERQPFFVSGIGQSKTMNAAEICGGANKIIKVEAQQTFIDVLLANVTAGIYTPRIARVYCSK
jgi:uncharacterized lipoprotein YajG